jgi:hypothetical protein
VNDDKPVEQLVKLLVNLTQLVTNAIEGIKEKQK